MSNTSSPFELSSCFEVEVLSGNKKLALYSHPQQPIAVSLLPQDLDLPRSSHAERCRFRLAVIRIMVSLINMYDHIPSSSLVQGLDNARLIAVKGADW